MTQECPSHLVVLAAGRGERLRPLTDTVPKPMVSVAGRPLLEHLLLRARAAGITRATVVVGRLGAIVRRHFGEGNSLGLSLRYVEQTGERGTVAALECAREQVADQPFLLSWGDVVVTTADYAALRERFSREDCAAVCALSRTDDPYEGAAVYVSSGRLTRLVEKPPRGTSTTSWNQAGVFALSPEVFRYTGAVPVSPRGERDFVSVLTALIKAGRPVLPYELAHGRTTLTRPADLEIAAEWLAASR